MGTACQSLRRLIDSAPWSHPIWVHRTRSPAYRRKFAFSATATIHTGEFRNCCSGSWFFMWR